MLQNRRLTQIALLSLVAIAGATGSSGAQGVTAAGTSRAVTVSARIEGRLGEILNIRAVGAPVQLADGTIEQRYAVVANVAFTMATPADNRDEIRVTEGGTEKLATEYVGTAGYHTEIRVRSPAPAVVSVLRRLGPATQAVASGSGN